MDKRSKETIRNIGEALILSHYPHLVERLAYIELWTHELSLIGGFDEEQRATLWGHVERSAGQQIYQPYWLFQTEAMKRIRHLMMGGDDYETIRSWASKLPEGVYYRDPENVIRELPYPRPKLWDAPPIDLSGFTWEE